MPNIILTGGGGGGGNLSGVTVTAPAGEAITKGDLVEYYAHPGNSGLTQPIVHDGVYAISLDKKYMVKADGDYFAIYQGDTKIPWADTPIATSESANNFTRAIFFKDSKYVALRSTANWVICKIGDTVSRLNPTVSTSNNAADSVVAGKTENSIYFVSTASSGAAISKAVINEDESVTKSTLIGSGASSTGVQFAIDDTDTWLLYGYTSTLGVINLTTKELNAWSSLSLNSTSNLLNYICPVYYKDNIAALAAATTYSYYAATYFVLVDFAQRTLLSKTTLPLFVENPSFGTSVPSSARPQVLQTSDPNIFRVVGGVNTYGAVLNCAVRIDPVTLDLYVINDNPVYAPTVNMNSAERRLAYQSDDKSSVYLHSQVGNSEVYEFLTGDKKVVRKVRSITNAQAHARDAYGFIGMGYAKNNAEEGENVQVALLEDANDVIKRAIVELYTT